MKSRLRLLAALLGAGLLAAAAAHAQSEDKQPRRDGAKGGGRGPGLEALVEPLGLTAEQTAKLRPVFARQRDQLQALRDDASLAEEERRQRRRAIMQESNQAISAVLTEEQRQKFAAIRGRGPQGDERPGGEGRPPAGDGEGRRPPRT